MDKEKDREWYLNYFKRMEDEDKKCMLGGMAWDGIAWCVHDAVDEFGLFTRNELAELFPYLLGHLAE